ncbi:CBU_0592 family membrane protein [Paraglaciecola sp. 2405UD69-4]|uniref:CBU_0592 family membrane protein n=1 Tax=Paraglaciecola sp. 2405UD69-4 TaxID=3391836 RepID=UPI0039C8D127
MIFIILGWFGTITYLVNHGYISFSKDKSNLIYYGGNFLAALSLVISSIVSQSYQAVVINGFWAIISILVLANINLKRLPINVMFFNIILGIFAIGVAYQGIMLNKLDTQLLGWSSAFVFSASYLLFTIGKMPIINYLIFNAYAAFVILPQVWIDQNWPVFALEICWGTISLYGAFRKINEVHLID